MHEFFFRKPHLKEQSDMGAITFDPQETTISQEILTDTQKVHFFQAVINIPIELGVQYLFDKKIGNYIF